MRTSQHCAPPTYAPTPTHSGLPVTTDPLLCPNLELFSMTHCCCWLLLLHISPLGKRQQLAASFNPHPLSKPLLARSLRPDFNLDPTKPRNFESDTNSAHLQNPIGSEAETWRHHRGIFSRANPNTPREKFPVWSSVSIFDHFPAGHPPGSRIWTSSFKFSTNPRKCRLWWSVSRDSSWQWGNSKTEGISSENWHHTHTECCWK